MLSLLERHSLRGYGHALEWAGFLWADRKTHLDKEAACRKAITTLSRVDTAHERIREFGGMPESDNNVVSRPVRCAIYTRKSSEEGLEKEFNSLDAQREAAEAYIRSQHTARSQQGEGWAVLEET
jgi:hypothetical protein